METLFGKFYYSVRQFLSDLKRNPLSASPNEYLKQRGFTRKKLINSLMKRGVLERDEKIDEGEDGKDAYSVKFKVKGKNFDRNIKRMFSYYFEKNVPEKKKEIDECSDCGSVGGSAGFGYDVAFGGKGNVVRRTIYEGKKKMRITESQFKAIQDIINTPTKGDIDECTTTGSVGNYAYDACGLVLKTSDGKKDPTLKR